MYKIKYLSALNDFIIGSDCKVFLPTDFDSTAKDFIIIVETLTDCSDFWTTQLLQSQFWR